MTAHTKKEKTQEAIFSSNYFNLTLVMEPAYKPQPGQDGKGRKIQFRDGKYITSNPEEIKFLKGVAAQNDQSPYRKVYLVQDA